jgi:hypothetical protein
MSTDFSYLNNPSEEISINKKQLVNNTKGKETTKNLPVMKFTIKNDFNYISERKEYYNYSYSDYKNSNHFTKSNSLQVEKKQRSSILQFLQERSDKKISVDISSTNFEKKTEFL